MEELRDELHDLNCSPGNEVGKIKQDLMGRACGIMGSKRNAYRIWGRKLGGKRPLGRLWRRLEYNIKIILHNLYGDFTSILVSPE